MDGFVGPIDPPPGKMVNQVYMYMGVSENDGTPNVMVSNGKPY